MFDEIESEFKKKSKYNNRVFAIAFIAALIIVALIVSLIYLFSKKSNVGVYLSLGSYLSMFLLYSYIFYFNKKNKLNEELDFWKFNDTIETFINQVRDIDIDTLKTLLLKNNVNTKEKILLMREHYRLRIPKYLTSGGTTLAILALMTSIGYFVYDSKKGIDEGKIYFIIFTLIATLLVLGVVLFLVRIYSEIFSRKALYLRLESLLTKIYFEEYLDKKPKVRGRKKKIVENEEALIKS